jgi:hypothetical protein
MRDCLQRFARWFVDLGIGFRYDHLPILGRAIA